MTGVSQGLAGVGGRVAEMFRGEEKQRREEREVSGSPRSGTHYTFEFLKGIVIVSRPSEEVESASVSHAGAREERSEARLALGWSPGKDPTVPC